MINMSLLYSKKGLKMSHEYLPVSSLSLFCRVCSANSFQMQGTMKPKFHEDYSERVLFW